MLFPPVKRDLRLLAARRRAIGTDRRSVLPMGNVHIGTLVVASMLALLIACRARQPAQMALVPPPPIYPSTTPRPTSTDAPPERLSSLPERLSSLPERLSSLPERLSSLPERLSSLPERLSSLPERLSSLPERLSSLPERLSPPTPLAATSVWPTKTIAPLNPTPLPTTTRARRIPVRDLRALNEYHRGIAYVVQERGTYRSEKSRRALDELLATGANYISLVVTWYQNDIHSTEIYSTTATPSDEDLAFVIAHAHAHGVKVLLKPQVNLRLDNEHWRGQIEFNSERDWQRWFESYRRFILHYARLAQQYGVEEFSVGTELYATTKRHADWRAIIHAVRQEYTGLLTYAANHSGEEAQIEFWDELDFIGVNAFYHLTNYREPTVEQLLEAWRDWPLQQITAVHRRFPDKPIIFTEVGYPSLDMANVWPWNWERVAAVDVKEQADLYEALFQMWWKRPQFPWFRGLFIWNWEADPEQGGILDGGYTPHGKPAEQILRRYFGESVFEE